MSITPPDERPTSPKLVGEDRQDERSFALPRGGGLFPAVLHGRKMPLAELQKWIGKAS
jgi:hypothetical protein